MDWFSTGVWGTSTEHCMNWFSIPLLRVLFNTRPLPQSEYTLSRLAIHLVLFNSGPIDAVMLFVSFFISVECKLNEMSGLHSLKKMSKRPMMYIMYLYWKSVIIVVEPLLFYLRCFCLLFPVLRIPCFHLTAFFRLLRAYCFCSTTSALIIDWALLLLPPLLQ